MTDIAPTELFDALEGLAQRVAAMEDMLARALDILDTLVVDASDARLAVDRATELVDEFRPMVEQFLNGKGGRVVRALLGSAGGRTIDVP